MVTSAPVAYPPGNMRHVTEHSLSFIRPVLDPGWSVLDIGCGAGYVLAELAAEGREVLGVDIVDTRKLNHFPFQLYDGLNIPCADGSYDMALLVFVLHHVPNQIKPRLVAEARRVARHRVVVFEDTPRTPLDWLAGWVHGHRERRQIGSHADFGYYNQRGWEAFFGASGFQVQKSIRIPRLQRLWYRPWARSCFVLDKA